MEIVKVIGIIISFIAGLILVILGCTSVWNIIEFKKWHSQPAATGKIINSGDLLLYIRIKGIGSPAVVIVPGLGNSSTEWWKIQDELSKFTRVFTYDRSGYGLSCAIPDNGVQITAKIRAEERTCPVKQCRDSISLYSGRPFIRRIDYC